MAELNQRIEDLEEYLNRIELAFVNRDDQAAIKVLADWRTSKFIALARAEKAEQELDERGFAVLDMRIRAEKAEAERDGLAEQLHNVRDSLLAYFSGSFLDNNIFTDEYKATLAGRDTRIRREARAEALREAAKLEPPEDPPVAEPYIYAYERGRTETWEFFEMELKRMAEEADHA